MAAPTPSDFLHQVIVMWEGGYESYREDLGNYVQFPDGHLVDIGTCRGVTPNALAAHRGVQPWTLTADDMRAVTVDEAVDIGIKHYYLEPHFDLFPWGPATASVVDFGWGSGPGQAIVSTQRLIGAGVDGVIGPITAKLYSDWKASHGWVVATQAIHDMRQRFIDQVIANNPDDEMFRQGWYNRLEWASAANQAWWAQWGVG